MTGGIITYPLTTPRSLAVVMTKSVLRWMRVSGTARISAQSRSSYLIPPEIRTASEERETYYILSLAKSPCIINEATPET